MAWRALGEETVVVDLRSNRMYGLNETGGRIWEALEESAEPESFAAILGLNGGDLERALMSIEDFLAELCAVALVEPTEPNKSVIPLAPRSEDGNVTFVPPVILFSEEIRNFGQSANMICFQDPNCNQGCG